MKQSLPHERLTETILRTVILKHDDAVQDEYTSRYREEIDVTIVRLATAYRTFQDAQDTMTLNVETGTVQLFIHAALGSLIQSTALLIRGYSIASLHMMRHVVESTAMAILCVDPRTGVSLEYNRNQSRFPVDSAPARLGRKKTAALLAESIGFERPGWVKTLETMGLFDKASHASVLTLALHVSLADGGGVFLGPAFDPAKEEEYAAEVSRRMTMAESLGDVSDALMRVLARRFPVVAA
jgi:hypothetical protein